MNHERGTHMPDAPRDDTTEPSSYAHESSASGNAPPTTPNEAGVSEPQASANPGPVAPTPSGERNETLDVIRGVALLGIFPMNVVSFGLVMDAYTGLGYGAVQSVIDRIAFYLTAFLFEQKMMSLFAILFGAGVALFADRAEAKGRSAARLHYRRMTLLLVFGLAHAIGLWFGDILVPYALAGMIVFLVHRARAGKLFAAGAALIVAGAAMMISIGWLSITLAPEEMALPSQEQAAEIVQRETSMIEAGYASRFVMNAGHLALIYVMMPLTLLPQVVGLMLVGMALYKSRFLLGELRTRVYCITLAAAGATGVALTLVALLVRHADGFSMGAYFMASPLTIFGALGMALAYAAAVVLIIRADLARRLRVALAAVGRTAFSNYILQTVLACLIFYRPGLGFFMDFTRAELWLVVAIVWTANLAFSIAWLRAFRMGPLEWLWRFGTYLRRPPLHRTPPATSPSN